MKQLICEMCGATDLLKEDGIFVCQYCGCKYSVEEARKMMIEGTVEVTGTVKVDSSDKLQNLYTLARRARRDNDAEKAAKYYEEIAVEDPNSWEANFYSTYYSVQQTTIGNIPVSASKLSNCLETAFELISQSNVDETETRSNIQTLYDDIDSLSSTLFVAYQNYFLKFRANVAICISYNAATLAITSILYNFGNYVEAYFENDSKYTSFAVSAWKKGLSIRESYFSKSPVYGNTGIGDTKASIEAEVKLYEAKIRKYDSSYNAPTVKGCYIATSVYGSYNCPQVWTLRRYRDYTLAETWYGRAFVRIYYAISPTLVKWLGHTYLFKKVWKGTLDHMVASLNAKGVKNTPYEDRNW